MEQNHYIVLVEKLKGLTELHKQHQYSTFSAPTIPSTDPFPKSERVRTVILTIAMRSAGLLVYIQDLQRLLSHSSTMYKNTTLT